LPPSFTSLSTPQLVDLAHAFRWQLPPQTQTLQQRPLGAPPAPEASSQLHPIQGSDETLAQAPPIAHLALRALGQRPRHRLAHVPPQQTHQVVCSPLSPQVCRVGWVVGRTLGLWAWSLPHTPRASCSVHALHSTN
jgi:hypothetical protein